MNNPYASLETCLGLTLLWWIWYYCWRPSVLDGYRQNLFRLRDDLFEKARTNEEGLTFQHPAYGAMRTMLNRTIRFSHRIHPFELAVIMVLGERRMKEQSSKVMLELEAVKDPKLREMLNRHFIKSAFYSMRYGLLSAPFGFCVCAAVIVCKVYILQRAARLQFKPVATPAACEASKLVEWQVEQEECLTFGGRELAAA